MLIQSSSVLVIDPLPTWMTSLTKALSVPILAFFITDTFGPGLSDRGGARPFPSLTTPAVAEEAPPPFIDIVLTPTVVPDPLPMRKLTSKLIVECKVTSNLQAISAWKSARGLS